MINLPTAKLKLKIKSLQAENKEYKEALAKKFNAICSRILKTLFPELQQQRDKLLEALEKYGRHKLSCQQSIPQSLLNEENLGRECTCGFEQAIAEGSEE